MGSSFNYGGRLGGVDLKVEKAKEIFSSRYPNRLENLKI
jgi:hypothetical protein